MSVGEEARSFEIVEMTRERATKMVDQLLAFNRQNEWDYWTRDNLLKELPSKWELSSIAVEGDEPIGYVICSDRDGGDTIHVHHIMVRQDRQNRRLGTLLYRESGIRALAMGRTRLTIKVNKAFERQLAMYERIGFRATGKWSGDYFWMEVEAQTMIDACNAHARRADA